MSDTTPAVPGLMRRLACMVYEGLLLFGVLFTAAYLYAGVTQQRDARVGQLGLQLFLLAVLALYFSWFWSRGGQTVAMKAWHLRVVDRQGAQLRFGHALLRFVAAWLWWAPALFSCYLSGVHHKPSAVGLSLAVGALAYSLLARIHPRRQYLHDVLCRTQVIHQPPQPRNEQPPQGPDRP
ncbi:RDD family protein [Roseateles sp. BYS180W]|uniref:RDD family protein n=1 Tax=Roseateles rivi TaxID=3299028 RepID=A0ABW7FVY2_9BURK